MSQRTVGILIGIALGWFVIPRVVAMVNQAMAEAKKGA